MTIDSLSSTLEDLKASPKVCKGGEFGETLFSVGDRGRELQSELFGPFGQGLPFLLTTALLLAASLAPGAV